MIIAISMQQMGLEKYKIFITGFGTIQANLKELLDVSELLIQNQNINELLYTLTNTINMINYVATYERIY